MPSWWVFAICSGCEYCTVNATESVLLFLTSLRNIGWVLLLAVCGPLQLAHVSSSSFSCRVSYLSGDSNIHVVILLSMLKYLRFWLAMALLPLQIHYTLSLVIAEKTSIEDDGSGVGDGDAGGKGSTGTY